MTSPDSPASPLLTATALGAHLAWTVPLGYVMYCGAQLDAQTYNLGT